MINTRLIAAMERWIEEGRRVESGEAELGEWCGNIKRRAA